MNRREKKLTFYFFLFLNTYDILYGNIFQQISTDLDHIELWLGLNSKLNPKQNEIQLEQRKAE